MPTMLSQAIAFYENNAPRGEYVLVLEGKSLSELKKLEQLKWEEISIEEHMQLYESTGMDRKEAMKKVAKIRGISKRDVYTKLLTKQ